MKQKSALAALLIIGAMCSPAAAFEDIDPADYGIEGLEWGSLYCKHIGGGRKAV